MNEFTNAKVALLLGGTSAEREVSLKSGATVAAAFNNLEINYTEIDVGSEVIKDLQVGSYTHVFNMLHGRGGEDGTIQGVLEWLKIPYTGSGVMASSIAMDKLRTKQLWLGANLPTAPYAVLEDDTDFARVIDEMQGKVMVKPAREGSSIGIAPAASASELKNAYQNAREFDDLVIAEKWLNGREYTVCLTETASLPIIGLDSPGDFYDYDAKYLTDECQYLIPSGLSEDEESYMRKISVAAFASLGCTSWGRIDVMTDENNKQWLLEANTLSGMTDHSFMPMAAKHSGLGVEGLVLEVLKTARLYTRL